MNEKNIKIIREEYISEQLMPGLIISKVDSIASHNFGEASNEF